MSVRNDVIHFCQSLGRDPLLVQGAGGNVSWKDGEVLWVKLEEAIEVIEDGDQ